MVDSVKENPLAMSDDDFLTMDAPVVEENTDEADKDDSQEAGQNKEASDDASSSDDSNEENDKENIDGSDNDDSSDDNDGKSDDSENSSDNDDNDNDDNDDDDDDDKIIIAGDPKNKEDKKEDKPAKKSDKKDDKKEEASKDAEDKNASVQDAVEFQKQIMAPFRANGKDFQVKSPKEAITLMQMGANYAKKMQAIQPHRKVLTMLENNELLDEGKLSYLIDLDKKDPEAIKKLIADSGMDPLDIDVTEDPKYKAGSHIVSDDESNFRTVLEELSSDEDGRKTVETINNDWDKASKQIAFDQPEIMSIINEQRASGIYDTITEEVDRQKTLGIIKATTPFIQAYQEVGEQLALEAKPGSGNVNQDKLNSDDDVTAKFNADSNEQGNVPKKTELKVVATRKANSKSQVKNGDKASAAANTRGSQNKKGRIINPLAMSDEDFIKNFNVSV